MIKEELEKEAEEKFKVNNKDKDREHFYDKMWFKTGYLAGAEPREKRIEELEQQIEKMKCCENCIHHSFWGNELKCNLMSYDDEFECLKTKSKWELDVK